MDTINTNNVFSLLKRIMFANINLHIPYEDRNNSKACQSSVARAYFEATHQLRENLTSKMYQ